MHVRGTIALALAALIALPGLASAAIVQRWQSLPANYVPVSVINDFNADDSFEMLTVESTGKIGIRSCSTGILLTQSATAYSPAGTFWLTYLEGTNSLEEIIFFDVPTNNLVCMNYSGGSLSIRWSFPPTTFGGSANPVFVDFDGTGDLYMVFKEGNAAKYYIRNNSGGLVSTIDHTLVVSGGGWSTTLEVDSFENNARQDLLIRYLHGSPTQSLLYLFGSNAAALESSAGASELHAGEHVRRTVRQIDNVNGIWTETKPTRLGASAALHATLLP